MWSYSGQSSLQWLFCLVVIFHYTAVGEACVPKLQITSSLVEARLGDEMFVLDCNALCWTEGKANLKWISPEQEYQRRPERLVQLMASDTTVRLFEPRTAGEYTCTWHEQHLQQSVWISGEDLKKGVRSVVANMRRMKRQASASGTSTTLGPPIWSSTGTTHPAMSATSVASPAPTDTDTTTTAVSSTTTGTPIKPPAAATTAWVPTITTTATTLSTSVPTQTTKTSPTMTSPPPPTTTTMTMNAKTTTTVATKTSKASTTTATTTASTATPPTTTSSSSSSSSSSTSTTSTTSTSSSTTKTTATKTSKTTTKTTLTTPPPPTTTEKATDSMSTSKMATSFSITTVASTTTERPTAKSTNSPSTTKVTTTSSTMTTTTTTTTDKSSTSGKASAYEDFGRYGGIAFAAAFGLALLLLAILVLVVLKYCQLKRRYFTRDEERNVPRLKMLEVRDTNLHGDKLPVAKLPSTSAAEDGLQTYSLDYEKHVQEKIEEHKKKTRSPVEASSSVAPGVSSFLIGKRPSNISSAESSSPAISPVTTPLLHPPSDEGVFNFHKKPGEATDGRRGSALEAADRRSNISGKGRKGSYIPSPDIEVEV